MDTDEEFVKLFVFCASSDSYFHLFHPVFVLKKIHFAIFLTVLDFMSPVKFKCHIRTRLSYF